MRDYCFLDILVVTTVPHNINVPGILKKCVEAKKICPLGGPFGSTVISKNWFQKSGPEYELIMDDLQS